MLSDNGDGLRSSLGDTVAMVCTEVSVLMLRLHMGFLLGDAELDAGQQVVPGMFPYFLPE